MVKVRAQAETHLGEVVSGLLAAEQKERLDALIAPAGLGETSPLQLNVILNFRR